MLIFGAGEFAEVAHFYFEQMGKRVIGFTTDQGAGSFLGKPVMPWAEVLPQEIYIAIGYSKQNQVRAKKLKEAKQRGFKPQSFVSIGAICLSRDFGEHVFILESNVIQPFVSIGENCVLWSGNHIGHHSRICADCFVTSHVVVSGGCELGAGSFVGVNSSFSDHIQVGEKSIITMGSRVTRDVPDNSVWDKDDLTKIPANRVKL